MATFSDLWQLLYDHGSSNYYKPQCNQIWDELSPARKQRLYDNISGMLRDGRFVSYNPLQAIHDNLPRKEQVRTRTMTYGEYYSTYGTTEETDGWEQRKTPEGKVYYEKAAHECATHKR